MFSISSTCEASVIAEILAFMGQLSIVCLFPLQFKNLPSFISRDVSASEFRGIGVIVPRSVLDRCKKDVLLLDIVGARKELVTALRGTLAVVRTIVKDLTFSLIRSVACICS